MTLRRLLALLLMLAPLPACAGERWAVYYTDKLPAESFAAYDTLVFDSDAHPPLAPLKAQGKLLLGYLSLGEAETYRDYYGAIKKQRLLLGANAHWKGHRVIDVRRPEWTRMVVDKLIPPILAQGFDGLMLDTIDSAIQPDLDNPKRYGGMKDASAALIKAIRSRYPHIKIMLNRGFEILPQVAGDIDMLMAESTYADWTPGEKKAKLVDNEERQPILDAIAAARAMNPKLAVYTVDYWPAADKPGRRRIYDAQRALGFVPYVATLDLQHLVAEPE